MKPLTNNPSAPCLFWYGDGEPSATQGVMVGSKYINVTGGSMWTLLPNGWVDTDDEVSTFELFIKSSGMTTYPLLVNGVNVSSGTLISVGHVRMDQRIEINIDSGLSLAGLTEGYGKLGELNFGDFLVAPVVPYALIYSETATRFWMQPLFRPSAGGSLTLGLDVLES